MAARTGAKHHNAKMTTAKVRSARKAYEALDKNGKRKTTIKSLAEKYGLATQTMWQIIHRKTWKDVA